MSCPGDHIEVGSCQEEVCGDRCSDFYYYKWVYSGTLCIDPAQGAYCNLEGSPSGDGCTCK